MYVWESKKRYSQTQRKYLRMKLQTLRRKHLENGELSFIAWTAAALLQLAKRLLYCPNMLQSLYGVVIVLTFTNLSINLWKMN